MGFISHHEIEWRLIGDGVRVVIVCEFSMGDGFRPGCVIIATEDSEVGFDFLVYSFGFTVGLRVVGSGKGKVVM